MLVLFFVVLIWFGTGKLFGQSCTSADFGTVGSTVTCMDFDAISAGAGSTAQCTGSGFGGSGTYRIVTFRTDASAQCVAFDLTGLAGASGTELTLWTGCSSGTPSGYVTSSDQCYSAAASVGYSTAGLGLAAGTTYYLRIWTKNAPTSSSTICARTETASNDVCTAPIAIGAVAASYNNYCMTSGTAGDPPPFEFCAFTLENNCWFSLTTLPTCLFPCTATIDITSIACSGGGNGFQIGWWTGSCGSLTSIGCSSGSGGTVTATINNLSPGQTVIVGLDGNAGAYCNFRISGTNIVALPVGFLDFGGRRLAYGTLMKWQVVSETENVSYIIERSGDNENWIEIYRGYVIGDLDAHGLREYEFTDDKIAGAGMLYYRLSRTDLNGNTTVLKTISFAEYISPDIMRVIPNPVSNEAASVSIQSEYETSGTIIIRDAKGQQLHIQEIHLVRGANGIKLGYESLKPGVYFLEFNDNDNLRLARFIQL